MSLSESQDTTHHSKNSWNSTQYDQFLGFVSQLGGGALEWLAPTAGERILDLGCGTGDLTALIAGAGAEAMGIDLSADMVGRARQKYPHIDFQIADARSFMAPEPFHAVFSNAALHWVKDARAAARAISAALLPGGRLCAEFGGNGNAQTLISAIETALAEHGVDPLGRNPWYFPTIGEYATLLEESGLQTRRAILFERPTPLPDGESGLVHWLEMFGDDFFYDQSPRDRKKLYRKISKLASPFLRSGGGWQVDYVRLRILALKTSAPRF